MEHDGAHGGASGSFPRRLLVAALRVLACAQGVLCVLLRPCDVD